MTTGGSAAPAPEPNPAMHSVITGPWGRVVRFARFGIVGASGFVVNEVALAIFVSTFGLNYLLGAIAATQVSTLWNFTLVELWAFRSTDAKRSPAHRLLLFFMVNNAALLLRGPVLVLLTSVGGFNYLVSNLVSLGLLTVVRFAVADNWIWATGSTPDQEPAAGADAEEPWRSIAAEVAVASVPGAELAVDDEPAVSGSSTSPPRRFFPIRSTPREEEVEVGSGSTAVLVVVDPEPVDRDEAVSG